MSWQYFVFMVHTLQEYCRWILFTCSTLHNAGT